MDIKESIRMAGVDIRLNKTRSLLSMLGIIIGIASVIIIVAIGNGLKYKIMSQFAGFGANRIYIMAGWDPDTQRMGEISMPDIAVLQSMPGVTDIAPQINWNAEIKGVNKSINMDIRGVSEDYFAIAGMVLDQGRLLSTADMVYRQKVCVVKPRVVMALFEEQKSDKKKVQTENPVSQSPDLTQTQIKKAIGKSIKIGPSRFIIVGVLSKEERSMGFFWSGPNTIFVPAPVLLRMSQMKSIQVITVQVEEINNAKKIGNQIINKLKERHKNKGLYHMQNPEDIQKEINTALNVFTMVIGSIGGLSLLVGGIGIMNIMLASVAERTREIGIRKAIGAKRRDILMQFLIEAGTISGCGGIVGITLGIALAKSISILTRDEIPSAILPSSILIALGFSILVGMFFGIYPSSKAANLNPMEALRYE